MLQLISTLDERDTISPSCSSTSPLLHAPSPFDQWQCAAAAGDGGAGKRTLQAGGGDVLGCPTTASRSTLGAPLETPKNRHVSSSDAGFQSTRSEVVQGEYGFARTPDTVVCTMKHYVKSGGMAIGRNSTCSAALCLQCPFIAAALVQPSFAVPLNYRGIV